MDRRVPMGYFKNKREQRDMRKALEKAANKQAKLDAKNTAKTERSFERYLRRSEKKIDRQNRRDKKQRDKENYQLAQQAVDQINAPTFSAKNLLKWVSVLQIVAPILLPLVYTVLNVSGKDKSKN